MKLSGCGYDNDEAYSCDKLREWIIIEKELIALGFEPVVEPQEEQEKDWKNKMGMEILRKVWWPDVDKWPDLPTHSIGLIIEEVEKYYTPKVAVGTDTSNESIFSLNPIDDKIISHIMDLVETVKHKFHSGYLPSNAHPDQTKRRDEMWDAYNKIEHILRWLGKSVDTPTPLSEAEDDTSVIVNINKLEKDILEWFSLDERLTQRWLKDVLRDHIDPDRKGIYKVDTPTERIAVREDWIRKMKTSPIYKEMRNEVIDECIEAWEKKLKDYEVWTFMRWAAHHTIEVIKKLKSNQ